MSNMSITLYFLCFDVSFLSGVKHKPTNQPLSLDMTTLTRRHFPGLYDNNIKDLEIP